jgi:hypothetical protein
VRELVPKSKPLGLATAVHWTRDTCCRPRIENPLRGQIWARTQAHQSWMAPSMRVSGVDRYPRFQCCLWLLGGGAISGKLAATAISCRMASADSISVTY